MKHNELVATIVKNIQGSYGNKYWPTLYTEFKADALKTKEKKALVMLVYNFFDLDTADARDMVTVYVNGGFK